MSPSAASSVGFVSGWSPALPSGDFDDDLTATVSDVPGEATWVTGDWMWENIFTTS